VHYGFFQRKISIPLKNLLKEGITPERLALSLSCGVTIGSFPVVGSTTAICIVIALALRLNLLAILLGNWLAYPLQLMLIFPFILLGDNLFGSPASSNPQSIAALFRSDMMDALRMSSVAVFHAAVAWAVIAPFALACLYFVFLPVLNHILSGMNGSRPS
jgi:uncharacterized protein (DUF2062 family)